MPTAYVILGPLSQSFHSRCLVSSSLSLVLSVLPALDPPCLHIGISPTVFFSHLFLSYPQPDFPSLHPVRFPPCPQPRLSLALLGTIVLLHAGDIGLPQRLGH